MTGIITLSLASGQNIEDLAGNALDSMIDPSPDESAFAMDNTAPAVALIERQNPMDERTRVDSLVWRVTFSEAVRKVDAADFGINGTTAELTVTAAETSLTVYEVSASGGDLAALTGTITLSLASGQNIEDLAGNALDSMIDPSFNENTFAMDNTAPAVASIERHTPIDERTSADSVVWRVTFSEAVGKVDAADFLVSGTTAELTVTAAETSQAVYEVGASGGDLAEVNGPITLSLANDQNIEDLAGNALDSMIDPSPDESRFVLDNQWLTVSSIVRHLPMSERTQADSVVWRVTFSKAVEQVDAADFLVSGTTAELTVTKEESSRTVYEVRASGGDLAALTGPITLSLASGQNIEDLAGNALDSMIDPSPDESTFAMDNTAPAVASIERHTPVDERTSADSVVWRVTFSEAVEQVDAADFVINGTTAELTVTAAETSLMIYEVSASGGGGHRGRSGCCDRHGDPVIEKRPEHCRFRGECSG